MPILWFSVLIFLASSVSIIAVQQPIDFSLAPNFGTLRDCAYCCFCVGINCTATECISTLVQCSTAECLCQPSISALAISYLGTCVRNLCDNEADVLSYGQVFQSYCASVTSAVA